MAPDVKQAFLSQPHAILAAKITGRVKTLAADASQQVDAKWEVEMELARGTHARTGSELVALLADWLVRTTNETLGDVSRFPRAPWVSVETPLGLMDLNADTRRSAVAAFLEHAAPGGGPFELHVVANRRGRVNKVVFRPDQPPPTGWYAYLRNQAPAPTSMTLS